MTQELAGITLTPDHSTLEDDATRAQLSRLNEDAARIGCVPALRKHNHNLDYLLDPRRSKYIDLADLQPHHRVLEIGSSLGQHTRLLAARCQSLAALEIVPLQAAFSHLWCQQDGLSNVKVISGGASGALPFADDSFDRVVCNYVLEWCAGRSATSPATFHHAYIADMHRVLKPGGKLLITTKNRFSLRYLLGGRDEHLNRRLGHVLPRALHGWMRRTVPAGDPVGYLHSWPGLDYVLRQVGFDAPDRLLAFPDNRYASYVGAFDGFDPADLPATERASLSGKDRLSLYLPRAAFEFTSNSLVALARKPAPL